jgi:hypothetical protein
VGFLIFFMFSAKKKLQPLVGALMVDGSPREEK